MKQNKVFLYDMILIMLKIKLNSEVVRHRGYVISGLPFVTTNRSHLCYINSLDSEEAFLFMDEIMLETIRSLKKKKKRPSPGSPPSTSISGNGEEEAEEEEPSEVQEEERLEEEEEDKPAELPKFILDTCSDILIKKKPRFESKVASFLFQLNELFNLYFKPDIIIHITCPEMDFVKMKGNGFINYLTGININQPFISNYKPELRWPRKCQNDNYENPHAPNVFHPKYNCKPPYNFEEKVLEQICNYKTYVYPYIEKKLKDFDPKMVIELDGRTSVNEMLNHVAETIILMQIQPVIIPQPLFLEESPEDLEEFWSSTVAELDPISSDVVNFKYYASPWFNRCPVELKLRRSMIGKPKYAVMLFKHVYLMSSLNNFIAFCRNPRPYLKLKYLEPICRIIVTGTKSSGKTMVSQCLSWIFDTPIMDFKQFLETEREKKYDLTCRTILSEIIATIEDSRHLQWQEKETERETTLHEWCNSGLELLETYVPLLIEKTEFDVKLAQYLFRQQLKAEKAAEKERIRKEKRKKAKEEVRKRAKEERERAKGEGIEEEAVQEEELEEEEIELEETGSEEEKDAVEDILEEMDPDRLFEFNDLRTQLSFLPILDSIAQCETVLKKQSMAQYAPIELLTVTNKPSIPVLGDEGAFFVFVPMQGRN